MSYLKGLREGLGWLDLHLVFQAVPWVGEQCRSRSTTNVLNILPKLVDEEVAQFYLHLSVSEMKTVITI